MPDLHTLARMEGDRATTTRLLGGEPIGQSRGPRCLLEIGEVAARIDQRHEATCIVDVAVWHF